MCIIMYNFLKNLFKNKSKNKSKTKNKSDNKSDNKPDNKPEDKSNDESDLVSDTDCVVCFESSKLIKVIPCEHRLCATCLCKILDMPQKKCPMCRSNISKTPKPRDTDEPTMDTMDTMDVFMVHVHNEIPLFSLPYLSYMPLARTMIEFPVRNDWARSRRIYPSDPSVVIIHRRYDHIQAAICMERCLPRSLSIKIHHVLYKTFILSPVSDLVDIIQRSYYLRIQEEARYSFFFNTVLLP